MYPQHYDPGDYYYLEPEPQPQPKPSFLKRTLHVVREVLETIVPAVLIALLINLFFSSGHAGLWPEHGTQPPHRSTAGGGETVL